MRWLGLDVHKDFAEVATRAIADAKIKTDKVDAGVLAQLLAAEYLPAVWQPDETTRLIWRLVARRANIVRQRTRLKNQVHAILDRLATHDSAPLPESHASP